ncbi:ATP-binding protein [Mycolicibacterium lacusdiani]|uniref:ATP-binding protein n=1 Tax=Mycolicibacterium lacusdiani TaxID=2895283 RepID=UPI001F02A628|nr:LuxR family transcriptional regulator [Mycolicibacterium lacusdiani]
MSTGRVSRAGETRAVDDLLDAAALGPAGLIFEGEPGIGKTTAWLDAIDRATARGVRVLSSRPAQTESVLAYAGLTDLLSSVDPSTWPDLPRPQQQALDRALLRVDVDDAGTDRRAVAAAFMSVLDALATWGTVLVAVDDLQWIDPSTAHVLAFALRRMTGSVGVLAAVRTSPDTSAASWLELARPNRLRRMSLQPLDVEVLHDVLVDRLGGSFPRPTMLEIFETSGGNPFYALELARSIRNEPDRGQHLLPASLTELVHSRIGSVDESTGQALLAVACLASPSVDVVAEALGTDGQAVVAMLQDAEGHGIIELRGAGIRFTHPLIARGVYSGASAERRRAMHGRVAGVVVEEELRARHLARAATRADPTTLRALDAAAELARRRGAPMASAELVSLAIDLGGDTPLRRVQLAGHYFNAGDSDRARSLLEQTIDEVPAGEDRARALHLLGVVRMFDDSFVEAAPLLTKALDELGDDPSLRAEILIVLSFAQVNAGRDTDAMRSAEDAVTLTEAHGPPGLLGQALGMRTVLGFMAGEGVDDAAMARALDLDDQPSGPIATRPEVQSAVLAVWSGRYVDGGKALDDVRRRCIEHGEESELMFVSFHSALAALWRSDFEAARRAAEDAAARGPQLGGDVSRYVALITRALLDSLTGDVEAARRDADEALAAGVRSGAKNLALWPVMAMGALDVSLENYDAALKTLQPLLSRIPGTPPTTEIIYAWFLPDAIEAMIQLGRLTDAEPWTALLETNGRRLDRPWMLAMAARCRAMLAGARGDVDRALEYANEALTQLDRIEMPFERARTQLLLGQLQRRRRRQDAAAASIRQALDTFDRLGTLVWAERARVQLTRTNVGPRGSATLTPSEQRVAELAATGMTNRDMAAALFISPKTVEANLSRVYRKLGIHSRAELGRWVGDASR